VLTERSASDIGGENSRRDPQRTAATAAALMIGLALVTLMAALAAGIIRPFERSVDTIFIADYAITARNSFEAIPTSVAEGVAKAPGVESIASVRTGDARVFGKTIQLTAVDPNAGDVLGKDRRPRSASSAPTERSPPTGTPRTTTSRSDRRSSSRRRRAPRSRCGSPAHSTLRPAVRHSAR
jgi:putative ABC transport system permease protein